MVFLVLLMLIAPVYLAPLFNTYEPLDDERVKDEILSMARASGIEVDDVFQFDASRQTTRISANVSGFMGTMRISLNDNLLNRCSREEVRLGRRQSRVVTSGFLRGEPERSNGNDDHHRDDEPELPHSDLLWQMPCTGNQLWGLRRVRRSAKSRMRRDSPMPRSSQATPSPASKPHNWSQ